MDKINVNLTEKSLDLVNLVGSADALQGGRGYYPHSLLAIPDIGDDMVIIQLIALWSNSQIIYMKKVRSFQISYIFRSTLTLI